MNAKEFFDLTAQVREAQKAFFAIPKDCILSRRDALAQSKKLEDKLDAEIKRVKEYQRAEEEKRMNPTFPGFDTDLINKP